MELHGYTLSIHALSEMMTHYPRVHKRYLFYPKDILHSNIIPVVMHVWIEKKNRRLTTTR